ncbi:mitochondrial ATPase complex subunit Atp10p [Monosporozyma unispora]|nr:Mitochondrial ATPase complex subunit atp10 [Kazachstania unispora]
MISNIIWNRTFSQSSRVLVFEKFLKPVIEASQKREHVVERLIKPIGLAQPPTARTHYSKGNSFKDLFDDEKAQRRTKELTLEMSKSGMFDMYTFKKTNGKLFIAPRSYWREDKSLYFPHIVGKSILKGHRRKMNIEDQMRGKLNIVRLFGNSIGEELSSQFFNETHNLNKWQNNSTTQLIEISWIENSIKSLIANLSLSKLRSNISEERQKNYYFAEREQLPFTIRDQLQINNILTGYTLIVDQNLKIRWMTCGGVSTGGEERDTMWKCVEHLQNEMAKPNTSKN